MNFIQKILNAGFVEQGQKNMLGIFPEKEKWIPKWWEEYPYNQHWFGVSMDHPDAFFTKDGFDGVVKLSLQGCQTGEPENEGDKLLMRNRACRYICIEVGREKIYETFSGKLPPENVMDDFIKASSVTWCPTCWKWITTIKNHCGVPTSHCVGCGKIVSDCTCVIKK